MHPVLFDLPGLNWPVRLFGLFIIDAFFISTMWVQWRYCASRNPEVAADESLRKHFRLLLWGIVVGRVVWIAVPIAWSTKVVCVLATDLLLAGVAWSKWTRVQKKKCREDADFLFNFAFWLLIVGFLGSRIFWIVTTGSGRAKFVEAPHQALFYVWDGGIVWYGGLIFAALYGAWYLWYKKHDILELGDLVMAGVALALFLGRWACLSAGDDYGKPAGDLAWGLVFPKDPLSQIPPLYQGSVALHPTQLYMSLNGLVLFLACGLLLRKKAFHGQVIYLYLILYAVGRSLIEIYRGDTGRGLYGEDLGLPFEVSSSQLISVPVVLVAAILYFRAWRRSKRDSATPTPAGAG